MQSRADKRTYPELPFTDFERFQEGYRTGRYVVGMKHRLGPLFRALPLRESLFYFPLILSPFLIGAGFMAFALASGRFWFLLALPISWLDYATSTGALNLFRAAMWFPVVVLGVIISLFYASLGSALAAIGVGFCLSSLLCSMGLGTAKMALEERVTNSMAKFSAAYRGGLVMIFDSETGKLHEISADAED